MVCSYGVRKRESKMYPFKTVFDGEMLFKTENEANKFMKELDKLIDSSDERLF